jgi:hypothetical protein
MAKKRRKQEDNDVIESKKWGEHFRKVCV